MVKSVPVVTIDGPGGVGKGTISQLLAQSLGWHLLDSGALYRTLALAAKQHAVVSDNAEALEVLAAHLDVQFVAKPYPTPLRIILEGEDVTDAIRSEACGEMASEIARLPGVREALLGRQRAFHTAPGLVADGRDMGTVVFPDAGLKIFLTATSEERSKRRHKQLKEKGIDVKLPDLLREIELRDTRDRERVVAPLVAAKGAHVIDTTALSIEHVLQAVRDEVDKHFFAQTVQNGG